MDKMLMENRCDFPVIIENELWRETWDWYISMAQKPTTTDAKREVLFQLAGDAKQQYAKTMKEVQVKQKKLSQRISTASKVKAKMSEITSNQKFILFLTILRWCIIITITLIIIFIGILSFRWHSNMNYVLFQAVSYQNESTGNRTRFNRSSKVDNDEAIVMPTTTEVGMTLNVDTADVENLESSTIKYHKSTYDNRIRFIKLSFILIVLLLLILFLFRSIYVSIKEFILSICYIINWVDRLISTPATNIDFSLTDRSEKIVLLDPMIQHSQLQTLFDGNLFVYTSIRDCFYELSSNRLEDYTLFLSFSSFEAHSFKLSGLSNVSLCIFYEDNDQPHPQISRTRYHIRFLFPKPRLLEHLRHVIILNHTKKAYMYRLQGLEREADENFLAASQQCRLFADDLEQQSSTINGSEPQDSVPYDGENRDDRYLPLFTFLPEH